MKPIYRVRENGKIQCIIPYKSNGKWTQKSQGGFDKMSEAKDWAKKTMFELMKIEELGIIKSDMTVGELFDLYIEDLELQGKAKNTVKCYEQTRDFFSKFSKTSVNKINAYDVKKFILQKQKDTGFTFKDYYLKFKSLLNFATKELKIIPNNPLDGIKIKFERKDRRSKFIDQNLYKKILDSLKKEKEKLFVRVLYETGVRKSEADGITIFKIKNCKLRITNQYDREDETFGPLKTKNSERVIPISKDLEKALLSQTTDINGRIFFDIKPSSINNSNLYRFNVSAHCFRHTFATNLVSSGIDLTIAAQIIGDDLKTVLSTYVQVNEDKKLNEFDKVRAMF